MSPLRCEQKRYKRRAGFELGTSRQREGFEQDKLRLRGGLRSRNLYSIPRELDTTDTHTPTPEVPRRTSLVRNLRRPWAPREHSPESKKEKSTTKPPSQVTPAKCRRSRGMLSCVSRAGGGGGQSLWSDTGVVLSPASEARAKLRIFNFQ